MDFYDSPAFLHEYTECLQRNALGNFKTFVSEIGLTNAMLFCGCALAVYGLARRLTGDGARLAPLIGLLVFLVPAVLVAHGLVAGELASAVDIDRVRFIRFDIGAILGTVEHVVGRVMYDQRTLRGGPVADDAGHLGIQAHRELWFLLAQFLQPVGEILLIQDLGGLLYV